MSPYCAPTLCCNVVSVIDTQRQRAVLQKQVSKNETVNIASDTVFLTFTSLSHPKPKN